MLPPPPTTDTPRSLGYRWPAEWEPHAAIWLAWPHNRDTWPGRFEKVPEQFAGFVRTVAEFEPVNLLAGGERVMDEAGQMVGDLENARLLDIPTNDAWCRDYGPIFLAGPPHLPSALIDWQYNAWGGKYPPYDLDNAVPARVAEMQRRRLIRSPVVLEGGAIENNGQGVLLTTRRCVLNTNRNAGANRLSMEGWLREYLSIDKVIWLDHGEIPGDDTDGHIDQLARFVNPTTIAAAASDDRNDPCFAELEAMRSELEQATDQEGEKFTLVRLPLPKPKHVGDQRLPASYCNFLIVNGGVIVPQFDDPADEVAIETLAVLLPDHQVRGCRSLELVWGLGAFHCLSQQEPQA